ncbi:Unknown protein, partial [Striga hermonthica]
LKTFEINDNYDKVKSKGLALKAAVVAEREESDDDEGPLTDDSELKKALALIARNYGKMSQRLYKNKFAGKKGNSFSKSVVQDKKSSMPLSKSDSQRVEKDQCRECRGFGHFHYECANLKKKNKSLKATWDDSDEEGTDEPSLHTSNLTVHISVKKFMCLTTSHAPTNKWYLDSGFSRHMTGEPSYLMNIQPSSNGEVTIGDGVSNKVIGTGCLNLGGIPKPTDVLLVDKLKANLLSVSQLCDQGLSVSFACDKCYVKDSEGSCVLTGSRSTDNCYLVNVNEKCLFSNVSEPEICHQRLGHIGYSHLVKLTNTGVVRGVPKIAMKDQPICEPCQLGKQTRTSH